MGIVYLIYMQLKKMAIAVGCNFDFAQEDELVQADIVIDDLMELKGYYLLYRDNKVI